MANKSLEAERQNVKEELHTLYTLRKKTRDKDVKIKLNWHEEALKLRLNKIESELYNK